MMVLHRKYWPTNPHSRMKHLDHNIQDVLQLCYSAEPKKKKNQNGLIPKPKPLPLWNICFVNKQIKAQLEFSQAFSRNHIESQILDEVCDNLQMNTNLLGSREEVKKKMFSFLNFPVCIEIMPRVMLNFFAKNLQSSWQIYHFVALK